MTLLQDPSDDVLQLSLGAWEGPLDLLLNLARAQKVDLHEISILGLVEQYLDFCRELADHVYIMDRGEIVHEGAAETLDTKEARQHLTV